MGQSKLSIVEWCHSFGGFIFLILTPPSIFGYTDKPLNKGQLGDILYPEVVKYTNVLVWGRANCPF